MSVLAELEQLKNFLSESESRRLSRDQSAKIGAANVSFIRRFLLMTFDICPNIANIDHLFFHMVFYVYGLDVNNANHFYNANGFKNLHAVSPFHLINV